MRINLDTTYMPVYNAYSGQTETMQAKWANLKKWKKKHLQRLLWEKQISANLILLLKTGRIRVVTRFSKRLTKNEIIALVIDYRQYES